MSAKPVFVKLDGLLPGHQLTSQMVDSGLLFVTECAFNELKELGVYPVFCLRQFALHCRDFHRPSVKARNDSLKYSRMYMWSPSLKGSQVQVLNISCELADETRRATCLFFIEDAPNVEQFAQTFREAVEAASSTML